MADMRGIGTSFWVNLSERSHTVPRRSRRNGLYAFGQRPWSRAYAIEPVPSGTA